MTLARNEAKQSPHSSPRLPRRAPNPTAPVLTSSNDTYAGGPSSLQSSGSTCSSNSSSSSSSSSSASSSTAAAAAAAAAAAPVAAAAALVTGPAALASAAAASAPPMVATVSHTVNGNLATHTNISLSCSGSSSSNHCSNLCTASGSGAGQANNLAKCNKSSSSSLLSQTQSSVGSSSSNSSSASSGVSAAQQNRLSAPASSSAATPSGAIPSGYVLYRALNKALSSDSPSSSSLESIYQQQHHHLMRQNTTTPPPLPPRKSSPGILTSTAAAACDAGRHKVAATPRTQQTPAGTGQLLVSRSQPQHQINSASSLCNLSNQVATSLNLSRSSENLSSSVNHVPRNKAPPVPKHQNLDPTTLTSHCPCQTPTKPPDLKPLPEPELDKVIVGPAETIVGIIDTRPLEARQPIILKVDDKADQNLVLTSTSNVYQFKPTSISTSLNGILSNEVTAIFQPVIHQVPPPPQPHHTPKQPQPQPRHQHQQQSQQPPPSQASNQHQRHQSLPANNAAINAKVTPHPPSKSITTSQLSAALSTITGAKSGNPLLYENVNLTLKECNGSGATSSSSSSSSANNNHLNSSAVAAAMAAASSSNSSNHNNNNNNTNVPYENINLEYIARLMQEGYSKENVITALGISRNNIEMACDILHEFVTKSGGGGGGGGGTAGAGGG